MVREVVFRELMFRGFCEFLLCGSCFRYIYVILDNGLYRLYKAYTSYFGVPVCMRCFHGRT